MSWAVVTITYLLCTPAPLYPMRPEGDHGWSVRVGLGLLGFGSSRRIGASAHRALVPGSCSTGSGVWLWGAEVWPWGALCLWGLGPVP